jgi:hypothetical protein
MKIRMQLLTTPISVLKTYVYHPGRRVNVLELLGRGWI